MGAALVATFVAYFGHVAAGAPQPRALIVVTALVFATVVSVALVGRSLSLWRVSLVVGISQFAFHGLFSWGSGGTASASGHHDHLSVIVSTTPLASSPMTLGHLVATVLTIAALYRGEVALRAIVRLARAVVDNIRWVGAAALPYSTHEHSITSALFARIELFLSEVSRRGPPVAASTVGAV